MMRDWLDRTLGLGAEDQGRLLWSAGVVIGLWALRLLILWIVDRRTEDLRRRYGWRKTTLYLAVAVTIVVLIRIWLGGLTGLLTYFGLLSAGLAIALKDLVTGLAGWAFILWRRPFEVGDRIQIGDVAGDVIDQRIFQFTLLEIGNWVQADQSTGRVIHVPNGNVFSSALANYTKGFQYLWNELEVLVTFESHWEDAKTILQEIADQHALHLSEAAGERVRDAARKFMIVYSKLTPMVYTSIQDSGVLLTVRYLTPPRARRGTSQAIWEDVLRAFAARDDIDFAYPTQRFYDNVREGKSGARAVPPSEGTP